ncbi:MAG: FAD-dependent monooxygenase [Actinomycetota bacterium]
MDVVVLGGGPAGLYASTLLKKLDRRHRITVLERNPSGATYGWGVVFSDRTLAEFREADVPTYQAITDRFVLWDAIDVRYRDELIRSGGHVFAGIARPALLGILAGRAQELGVDVRFDTDVADPGTLEADLVIAADGVNSAVRAAHADVFRPRLSSGRSRYIWFGTNRVLDSFTFIFRENDHGLFQVHAYPFDGHTSTWIVECDEATWRAAGLDQAGEAEGIRYCEKLFAEDLRGHPLMSNRSQWISFVTIRNRTWRHGNVVLLGDAAHTAHFSIGSGTKLAMEDAISLARGFERHPGDIGAALADYELERKPVVERFQEAADESRTYFENTRRYLHLEPMQFAFHLFTRSGRIDYDDLRRRDPHYVDEVDRWFVRRSVVAPPPLFSPLELRGLTVSNRVAAAMPPTDSADQGTPGDDLVAETARAAAGGAGLVVAPVAAVSPEGRITPGSPGLFRDEHVDAWAPVVEASHAAGVPVAIQIGHAGRRGSTRPRTGGLDRPLREGGWPLVAASPLPYGTRSPRTREMDGADMDRVTAEFAAAAERAAAAGADLVVVHMAHGYLLGGFLSPLSNRRADGYGGALESRLRFPLRVFEAVRAEWPAGRPLGAAIPATDWARGGLDGSDAVAIAAALKERGCDLVVPLGGQTIPGDRPRYGRSFMAPYTDRVRNEAGVATLCWGGVTTTGEVNTIVAGGRADLCVLDRRS